jgi:hypothetical protein
MLPRVLSQVTRGMGRGACSRVWHEEEGLPGDPLGFDVVWRIPYQQLVRAILRFIRHGRTARDPIPKIVILQPVPLGVGELL